ncbi:MAG: FHA domain-containing protein [Anaerolineales bacterium]|nr:FHA domain-containing protein [Anaerolineales bacterium]
MPVKCSHCGEENIEGALFCSQCGTKVYSGGVETVSFDTEQRLSSNLSVQVQLQAHENIKFVGDALVSLHLLTTGQILPLTGKNEYTLGRVSASQSILPDIDLTTYGAFNQGVSRLHATIHIDEDDAINVMDLGSGNGTLLNGEKISPFVNLSIHHGDVITLGSMKIQILVRPE